MGTESGQRPDPGGRGSGHEHRNADDEVRVGFLSVIPELAEVFQARGLRLNLFDLADLAGMPKEQEGLARELAQLPIVALPSMVLREPKEFSSIEEGGRLILRDSYGQDAIFEQSVARGLVAGLSDRHKNGVLSLDEWASVLSEASGSSESPGSREYWVDHVRRAAKCGRLPLRHPENGAPVAWDHLGEGMMGLLLAHENAVKSWLESEHFDLRIGRVEPAEECPARSPGPSAEVLLGVSTKAASKAAVIVAAWPEPNWPKWQRADRITLGEAAALSINKEPGQQRAVVRAGRCSAVHWVIPEYTFPEAQRRLALLRVSFPADCVSLRELANFAAQQEWSIPAQISRLFADPQPVPGGHEPPATKSTVHTSKGQKGRADPLDHVLEIVRQRAPIPGNSAIEWQTLVQLARSDERPQPLIGYDDREDAVRYQSYDSAAAPEKLLKRGAFLRRVQKRLKKPSR